MHRVDQMDSDARSWYGIALEETALEKVANIRVAWILL